MSVFELLLIAAFILFPVMEQVLKRKNGPGSGAPDAEEEGAEPDWTDAGPAPREVEPTNASDMVPDDLWAVLTGEQRRPEPVRPGPDGGDGPTWPKPADSPVSMDAPSPLEAPDTRWDAASDPSPWWEEDEPRPEPVSLEYEGPEAYSLERFEREPTSLESPLRAESARRRRARERTYERATTELPPRRPPARTPLGRDLGTPAGLRRAFVLSEVLGPPKGLE